MILTILGFAWVRASPLAVVVQPLPRDTMASPSTEPPCGGVARGKSHLLSQPGSLNPISWKVITPSAGTCSLKLIYGSEYSDPHTLYPIDDSADASGNFPCGQEQGLFKKIVQFPEDSCDSCTLIWIWQNEVSTYYHCVDVEITQDKDSACYGKCQNGGFCSDGLCICEEGYSGTFCQLDGRGGSSSVLGLFCALVLLFVTFLYLLITYSRISKGQSLYVERLIFRRFCFWLPFGLGDLGK